MKGEKTVFYALTGGLFLFPVLFIFQGLDLTDMGYVFVVSRDTLSDPGNVPGHATLLSMFLNGLWMKLSASWGVVGARFGFVTLLWCVFGISYRILRGFMSGTRILTGLLLTFAFTFWMPWINYNDVTALFALLSLCIFFEGIKRGSVLACALAGAVCGLAFFARLPNVLMLFFFILPLLARPFAPLSLSWRDAVRYSSFFLLGWLSAFIALFGALFASGYGEFFLRGVRAVSELASSEMSWYSPGYLLKLFFEDHVKVFGAATIFLAMLSVGAFIAGYLPRFLAGLLFSLYGALFFVCGWRFYEHSYFLRVVVGALYFHLLMKMWYLMFTREARALFVHLGALCVLVLVPLGSGNGIYNARFAMWLALPLFLNDLLRLRNLGFAFGWKGLFEGVETKTAFWFKRLFLAALVILSFTNLYRYTYRDSPDRFAMRHMIDHPILRGVFTTEERASEIQAVLDELGRHARPGDYLLAYGQIPTVYYLTGTKPYLFNPWPYMYTPQQLEYYARKAERERPVLPVVLRRTGLSPDDPRWRILYGFVEAKEYRKTWEGRSFEILLPPAPAD